MVGLTVLAAAASAAPDGSCKPKVLVTGISGYVASHVAKAALAAGYDVKGTVRSAKLNAPLAVALPGVEVVELDLLGASVDDVARALDGCQYLAHVASPFPGATVDADQVTHPCTRTCTRTRATPTPDLPRRPWILGADARRRRGDARRHDSRERGRCQARGSYIIHRRDRHEPRGRLGQGERGKSVQAGRLERRANVRAPMPRSSDCGSIATTR